MIVNTYTILVLGLICPLVAPPISLEVEEPCNEIELCNEFYTLTTTDGTSIYGGVVEQYTIDDNIYLIIKDHDMPYYFVSLKKTKKNDVYDTNLEGVIAKKVEKIINSTNNLAAMDPEHLKSLSLEEREAIFHEFVVTYGNYSNSCEKNYSILQDVFKVHLVELLNFLNNTKESADPITQYLPSKNNYFIYEVLLIIILFLICYTIYLHYLIFRLKKMFYENGRLQSDRPNEGGVELQNLNSGGGDANNE